MSTRADRQNKKHSTATPVPSAPLPSEPFSPFDARKAEEDARQRPLTVSQEVIDNRRRGRIEVETKRISEEITRQAQARMRASRAATAPSIAYSESSPRDEARSSPLSASRPATAPQPQLVAFPIPTPITRVIVPLDGTSYSERALPYIAPVAHMTGADITLLRVALEPFAHALDTVARSVDRALTDVPTEPLTDPTKYLTEIQAQLASRAVEAESMSVTAPSPVEGIELVMERLDANLVILATHARYGIQQRLLGSVGDRLVQQGQTPVLLIPPHADIPTYPLLTFSRVLVPLDGSMLAEQSLASVLGLAQQAAAREHSPMHIVLFYVADNHISRRDGVRYVEGLRERLLALGLPASVEVTAAAVVGSPPGAIVGAAEHGIINLPDYPASFDLVAMATHGRGGMQRWIYGSVAAYVLPRIKTPVLLVHPHQPDLSDM